jgi:hypothetical protein
MTISLSGFIEFVRTDMGVDATQVPDNSPSISLAYGGAVEWVNPDIEMVMPMFYATAVYNLARRFWSTTAPNRYSPSSREKLKLNDFKAGVITGAGDNATSAQRLVPDFFKDLSLADLQMLQRPVGPPLPDDCPAVRQPVGVIVITFISGLLISPMRTRTPRPGTSPNIWRKIPDHADVL